MAIQWGIWNFDGAPVSRPLLDAFEPFLHQWGPDANGRYFDDAAGIGLAHRHFHVTHEDFREQQPYICPTTGNVLTWDGRLDNREQLMRELDLRSSSLQTVRRGSWNPGAISTSPFPRLVITGQSGGNSLARAGWRIVTDGQPTDVELVAAAFARWGREAFARLEGDWTAVLWQPSAKTLWFAKDVIGPRRLHYLKTNRYIVWAPTWQCLRWLVEDGMLPGATLTPDRDYIAAQCVAIPAVDSSLYREIRQPRPAHTTKISQTGEIDIEITRPAPVYNPDRTLIFPQACRLMRRAMTMSVLRRMRSAFPILFELSGGADSSTLVGIAHWLKRQGKLQQDLHTFTFEGPEGAWSQDGRYSRHMEEFIGRRGYHLRQHGMRTDLANARVDDASPNMDLLRTETERKALEHGVSIRGRLAWVWQAAFAEARQRVSSRVLISGVGGDELMGGVQQVETSLWQEWPVMSMGEWAHSLLQWSILKQTTIYVHLWKLFCYGLLPLRASATIHRQTQNRVRALAATLVNCPQLSLAMVARAFRAEIEPWSPLASQGRDEWALQTTVAHKNSPLHLSCVLKTFPYLDAGWVGCRETTLPAHFLQTAYRRRFLLREASPDWTPIVIRYRRSKDLGTVGSRRQADRLGLRVIEKEHVADVRSRLMAEELQAAIQERRA
jgi:asparagine synthetase B (glutamine-hydrolysing)